MSPDQHHPSREDLFAYRDGELKQDRRAVIEAHVVSCHVCRELIDEVSRAEADLKSRTEEPGERYLERLTERVMEKVHASAAAPIAERRHSETEMEWEAKRARAPRLPWVALISTASAAATVLVVVILLFRQGAVWKHPPEVSVLEGSAPDAARKRGKADSLGARKADAGKKRANKAPAKEDAGRDDRPAQEPVQGLAKVESGEKDARQAPVDANREEEKATRAAGVADEAAQGQGKIQLQQKASGSSTVQAPSAQAVPSAPSAASEMAAEPAGERFGALLHRYGLPPTWGPGISDENVLRAEPALRNLYRTGGLESAIDSARARLYFAEAARVKAGAAPDSETVEEIIHHYQRAIRLSAGHPDTRGVAAQRLQEFLDESAESP